MDVICQAKSGMGKTAVFVLSTLQQVDPVDGEIAVVVLSHTRELRYARPGLSTMCVCVCVCVWCCPPRHGIVTPLL